MNAYARTVAIACGLATALAAAPLPAAPALPGLAWLGRNAPTPAPAGVVENGCALHVGYAVEAFDDRIRLSDGDDVYELQGDRVIHNGRPLSLNRKQRQHADAFRRQLEALLPQVTDLAIGGAMLGVESLAIVTAALSGDHESIDALTRRVEVLSLQLHRQFDGRHLPAHNAWLGPDLEAQIEDLASSLTGNLAAFVARAIFDAHGTEARSEYLEHIVERRIEPRAEALRSRAETLCKRIEALDRLETEMGVFDLIEDDRQAI
ncbi:MAG: DUF2884 family protein [Nevskiales bacterium]|nr:DUF2884 family protein [Nevskiales bacterium]